jgi:hypothetical protein
MLNRSKRPGPKHSDLRKQDRRQRKATRELRRDADDGKIDRGLKMLRSAPKETAR